MPKTKSTAIAYSSLMVALSICVMYLFALSGIGQYVGPLLASVGVLILSKEFGKKYGILCFIATAIIAFLIIPDRELPVFYLTFAWYPLILGSLQKIKSKLLGVIVRLIIFLAIIMANILILMKVIGLDVSLIAEHPFVNGIYLVPMGFSFVFLDIFYARLYAFYKRRIRKYHQ